MEEDLRVRGVREVEGRVIAPDLAIPSATGSSQAAARASAAALAGGGGVPSSGEMVQLSSEARVFGLLPPLWSRPGFAGVLAVGGLIAGCAVSAFALGAAGLLVTVAVEAMAFAGGVLVSRAGQQQLEVMNRRLHFEARHDPLTGLRNRGAIQDILERELLNSGGRRQPMAVILADVDHFKVINDRFGHLVGDEVLRALGGRFAEALRTEDAVGRYGGEEFLVVLPGAGALAAAHVAERIRRSVAGEPVPSDAGPVSVTASFGVASTEQVDTRESKALLQAADDALYRAKEWGRNRVVVAGPR